MTSPPHRSLAASSSPSSVLSAESEPANEKALLMKFSRPVPEPTGS